MATTLIDRFVHWTLDFDGDLYGEDERERLRWYEGIATAAQVQWIAVPWAAAALVWAIGRPAVLPLVVTVVVLLIPVLFCTAYVERRRVVTTPRVWTGKRVALTVLGGLPYVLFGFGVMYHLAGPESSFFRGALQGAVIGLFLGVGATVWQTRKRRRQDAAVVEDED